MLWGTSYSGGHCVVVAAEDRLVAAVDALTPATDGLATLTQIVRHAGVGRLLRMAGHGLRDAARALSGGAPHLLPIIGPPGTLAMMNTPDAETISTTIVGPTFRNEVHAARHLRSGSTGPSPTPAA